MARIVHLGLGNFHRAHQAWYTHRANAAAETPWSITGVAMREPTIRDAMAASGGAYDLGILGAEGMAVERITLHDRLLLAAERPGEVVAALADPEVRAITLTITEKGYAPGTRAIDLLASALIERAETGAPGVTVLSCDNLAGNGAHLKAAIADTLARRGAELPQNGRITFPDTMVDRITPATTDDIADRVARAAGRAVVAPVLTEAFSEWIIEDEMAGPLPDWAGVGARLVADVEPYERRKLLLLNAAHSALAYGGLRRGHAFVHEAMGDPDLAEHVRALWTAARPLLPGFSAQDVATYTAALETRFSVPGMAHRLDQIATDGSVKLRERLLPILRHHRFDCPAALGVLADWWAFLQQTSATRAPLGDPAANALHAAMDDTASEPERFARALETLGLDPSDGAVDIAARCLAAREGT